MATSNDQLDPELGSYYLCACKVLPWYFASHQREDVGGYLAEMLTER
jgi:hypothetical protein